MSSSNQHPPVTLFIRPGCHLCSDALQILQRLGFEVHEVNIEDDPALRHRYGFSIPVMALDGVDLVEGRFSEAKVRTALKDHGMKLI